MLGACRESGVGEESISIANQKQRISQWAKEHGHTVVSFTVDKHTSGGTPAREREDLGPWLKDPAKISQWDILATAKLDRGFRSVLDFAQTQEWADKRGKSLVSVAEGYDFTTPEGELMAYQLVAFAQFERKRAGQRRAEAAEAITEQGRWDGGRFPYGYTPTGSKGNYRLVKHPEHSKIAHRMVMDAINGKGADRIARELNAEGILAPLGKPWHDNSIRRILMSPSLIGYAVKWDKPKLTPQIVRDRDGQPVKFTDAPIITQDEYRRLQDALRSRSKHRGQAQARHVLWNVLFCRACSQTCDHALPCPEHDAKMYGHRRVKDPTKGNYYDCRTCGFTIRLEVAEETVARRVLRDYGKRLLVEPVTIPGDDHAVEITRLERRAERLRAELDEDYDEDLANAIKRIERNITDLRNAPHEPERTELRPVVPNITVADHWARIADDPTELNKFLRDYGFVFYADETGIAARDAWTPLDDDDNTFPLTGPKQVTSTNKAHDPRRLASRKADS